MSKLDKITLKVKNLFIKNQPFILFSIMALSIPVLLSYIPYVNLVYTIDNGVIIYLFMIFIFIRPSTKFLLMFGIILLFFALIFLLFGLAILAGQIGNIIFFLLAIGVFSIISAHFSETKS